MPITAKVIAKSTYENVTITTFELEYPRFIHSEFMTHRQFSRNAASSRAIPVKTQLELIADDKLAKPCSWGKNKSGMQSEEELPLEKQEEANKLWCLARDQSTGIVEEMIKLNLHKQVTNRILEPFVHIKVVLTATEYDNWYELRNHKDAQPEIQELARAMLAASSEFKEKNLKQGEWHVPYYNDGAWNSSCTETLEQALAISASCCAQVSYRKLDDSIEKAEIIKKRLVESKPWHASPFEHQATPIVLNNTEDWKITKGITHQDKKGNYWSANFKSWIQYRQLEFSD